MKESRPPEVTQGQGSGGRIAKEGIFTLLYRQGIFLNKLGICLTSNSISDLYEIDHGDSKSDMGQKQFGPKVTYFMTSSTFDESGMKSTMEIPYRRWVKNNSDRKSRVW